MSILRYHDGEVLKDIFSPDKEPVSGANEAGPPRPIFDRSLDLCSHKQRGFPCAFHFLSLLCFFLSRPGQP